MTFFELVLKLENLKNNSDDLSQAICEAAKGLGQTYPNPPVGCVITKNNQIISRGYHKRAGEDHAEAMALKIAGNQAKGADLYVTLEPCNHTGKTGPCTEKIIKSKIKKVFYACEDPNSKVSLSGADYLRKNNIEVEEIKNNSTYLLAQALIKPFKNSIQYKRPLITAKIASSLDGKIARKIGERSQITGEKSQELVFKAREIYDAVLVGSNTVLIDNPRLTSRRELSLRGGVDDAAISQPIRIVLDSLLKTDPSYQVYAPNSAKSCVVHTSKAPKDKIDLFKGAGVICLECGGGFPVDLKQAFAKLHTQLGLTSILVEPGKILFKSLLNQQSQGSPLLNTRLF